MSALNKHTEHSDRPCSLRGINNIEVNRDSLLPVSVLLAPAFSFLILNPPHTPSPITPLKLHCQGSLSFNVCALKQNIKVQHQFKMSSETVVTA